MWREIFFLHSVFFLELNTAYAWNMALEELSRPNVFLKLVSHPCVLNTSYATVEPASMLVVVDEGSGLSVVYI
jgi:hypothetical protein